MAHHETEDGRAVDKVQHEVGIEAGADLAPRYASLPDGFETFPARREEALAEELHKLRIALSLGDELAIDATCRSVVEPD